MRIKHAIESLPYYWLYLKHKRFFNDGIVELIALVISNIGIYAFSTKYNASTLILLNLLLLTAITFSIKYLLHKYWVWVK